MDKKNKDNREEKIVINEHKQHLNVQKAEEGKYYYKIYMNPNKVQYEIVIVFNDDESRFISNLLKKEVYSTEDDAMCSLLIQKHKAPESEKSLYNI